MSNRLPSATMSALLSSMDSLAQTLHRFPCRVLAYRESVPPGLSGSFVAVSGGERSLRVGLLSDPMGWQTLGRAFYDEELSTPESLARGAAELTTAAAQAFRRELPDARELSLGPPLYVDGAVVVGEDTELEAAEVVLGSTRALLVLLDQRRA